MFQCFSSDTVTNSSSTAVDMPLHFTRRAARDRSLGMFYEVATLKKVPAVRKVLPSYFECTKTVTQIVVIHLRCAFLLNDLSICHALVIMMFSVCSTSGSGH